MKIKLYFITALSLMIFSFNVFAKATTNEQCAALPTLYHSKDNILDYYSVEKDGKYYSHVVNDDVDCVYVSSGFVSVSTCNDGYYPCVLADWIPVRGFNQPEPTDSNTQDKETGTSETGNTGKNTDSSIGDVSTTPESPSSSDSGTPSGDVSPEPITPVDISGISTPFSKPVPVPDIVVNGSGIRELVDSFEQCKSIFYNMPKPDRNHYNPSVTTANNSVVDSCNAIYDQMSSILQENEVNSPLDNNHDFYTKNKYGAVFHCKDNGMNFGYLKLSKLDYPNRCSVNLDGSTDCSFFLNINFGGGFDKSYVDKVCSDAYSAFLSSGDANKDNDNSGADVASGTDGKPTDPSVTNPTFDKGQGGGNISGDFTPPSPATGDNADVVNAINNFHHDANIKSDGLSNQIKGNQSELLNKLDSINKQLIDVLKNSLGTGTGGGHGTAGDGQGGGNTDGNGDALLREVQNFHRDFNDSLNRDGNGADDKSDPDYDAMESDFKSQVGGEMDGLGDSISKLWDDAIASMSDILSHIDDLIPEIKTSFDLPPQFVTASQGRCIPLVLDFDIQLIGIPNYHFHGAGMQSCQLYDEYIRPVLNFIMIILTFFSIRRLLMRSAEFLTQGK